MTQLSHHPAYLVIEDRLDIIRQKFRILQILRGSLLWLVCAAASSVAAALLADRLGAGRCTTLLSIAWIIWTIASALHWIARPMFRRVSSVAVARMVETRVDGLHNGLTNSVLLAEADDLSHNPWLGQIFDEILALSRSSPLNSAVKFSELASLAARLAAPLAVAILLVIIFPADVAHGWQQMISPRAFVPVTGGAQLLEITPGNATIVAGQPLEIGVTARSNDSTTPVGTLYFDSNIPSMPLIAAPGKTPGELRYSYHLDHADSAFRYRAEIAGTQSDWYSIQVVPKVTLNSLDVKITPPPYTRQPPQTVTLAARDLLNPQIIIPAGSTLEIGAMIDVPVRRAVLMINSQPPVDMAPAMNNHRFYLASPFLADATAFVALMSADQIIAKLPDNGLSIRCTPDAPPTVVMQWPAQDISLPPTQDLLIKAQLHDDYGVTSARLLVGYGNGEPSVASDTEQQFPAAPRDQQLQVALKLPPEQSQHDSIVTLQVEATDNRDLTAFDKQLGPQSARGPKLTIHFLDPKKLSAQEVRQTAQLSARLQEMIKLQTSLRDSALNLLAAAGGPTTRPVDATEFSKIGDGQSHLRDLMRQTALTFEFDDHTRVVQKTLQFLTTGPATDAVDLSAQVVAEPLVRQQFSDAVALKSKQESILDTLAMLLAGLNDLNAPTTQSATTASVSLPSRVEAFKKLDEALKEYEKEQQRILNQTAPLAKKPVADYDDKDKKDLADLKMAQDKLDAFMQQALSDFSKSAEQDMSNPSLLKELIQVYSEVTMAKDALNKQSAELAVPLEESGLESAEELKTNIEKWLGNTPDRTAWTMEDPLTKPDTPMAELPKELEDMVGNLLEQQEDLDQQMEDANANWQDSFDKAVGWDAMDGPIADMSAKGVTGNVLPNNNEMQGRSGDGRNGQSQGEAVGDTATDKGGRNTPTRLDPTPFQAGQIKDTSPGAAGGATGGGKMSGEGASGLEGPVPPKQQLEMQRLAKMQAAIRNSAEHLNLQYKLGRYDNFKLLQSIVNMRRVESDLDANRYQNALRHSDELVDDLSTSSVLLGGRMQVDTDSTPAANHRQRKEIDDALQGDLPPVWSDSLREYYRKLSQQ